MRYPGPRLARGFWGLLGPFGAELGPTWAQTWTNRAPKPSQHDPHVQSMRVWGARWAELGPNKLTVMRHCLAGVVWVETRLFLAMAKRLWGKNGNAGNQGQ